MVIDIKKKYAAKAEDSFKTKRNLFLFDHIIYKKGITNVKTEDFASFEIDDKIIKIYTTQYYQQDRKSNLTGFDLTPDEIYMELSGWIKEKHQNEILRKFYIEEYFPKYVFPLNKFSDLFNYPAEQKCFYCGITEQMVKSLISCNEIFTKRERGHKLEIDRKEANKEYTQENSVLCCYWCNNAKTDEFSFQEFIPVGKYFRLLWNMRLHRHNLPLIVES